MLWSCAKAEGFLNFAEKPSTQGADSFDKTVISVEAVAP